MDNRFEMEIIRVLSAKLHEKYGYNEKECQAYIRGYQEGYQDSKSFQPVTSELDVHNCNSDLNGCVYKDGLGAQRSI